MSLMSTLSHYWEVEHRPKYDLNADKHKEISTKSANLFYIVVTIAVFTLSVFFVIVGVTL